MKNYKIIGSALLAGLLVFSGCGDSGTKKDPNPPSGGTDDPHPGETAAEVKARYLKDIKATNTDLNLSNQTINTNLTALAECLYSKDKTLKKDDIIATFGSGVRTVDLNATSGITCANVSVRKVGGTFSDSLNVLYYNVANPVTNNRQLLAYNYDTKKAHVVNSNVVLGSRTFLFKGEKDGDKAKYTGRLHGLYLDPNQEHEVKTVQGRYGPTTYKFFSNNALMKFDATNPTNTTSFFNSSQIPSSATGLTKLGDDYKVYENIVDPGNSYIGLKAFDSLADTIAGESEDNKTSANITFRIADKKAVLGRPIMIIKDDDMKTKALLISEAAPFKPSATSGSYSLKRYNPTLTSKEDIADGEYYFATQNSTHVYLFKEGNNKIWALAKDGGGSLSEVAGVTLAGNYALDIHGVGAWHGGFTRVLNGAASTLSGRNEHLGKGENAYVAFHYDLHPNAVVNAFGTSGAYKSVQIWKLTGASGTKLMDNADGVDHSMGAALDSEKIKGHANLIVATDDKIYVEMGWWDGNDTVVGGNCTDTYMSRGMAKRTCTHVKYGYLDTSTPNATDITPLMSGGENIEAKSLPYYVSRRVAPMAVDGKLYISTFNGGGLRTGGYKFKKYSIDIDNSNVEAGAGRIYFTKTADASNSGEYSGTVMSWDAATHKLEKSNGTVLGDTEFINGSAQGSISGRTNGVPLAGIGKLGMLKNNDANHAFTLFVVDTENGGFKSVDFAPFGGWIYD